MLIKCCGVTNADDSVKYHHQNKKNTENVDASPIEPTVRKPQTGCGKFKLPASNVVAEFIKQMFLRSQKRGVATVLVDRPKTIPAFQLSGLITLSKHAYIPEIGTH